MAEVVAETAESEEVPPPTPNRTPVSIARGLIRTARPKQWAKNVLVLAAPFAAGKITHLPVLGGAAIAFIAFCLAASSIYLVNDAKDVEADRAHPTKRNRPIAAGIVPVPAAFAFSAVLMVASVGISFIDNWEVAVVIGVYLAVQLGYCFGLKHERVIDLCIVASGFLLRAIAGGVGAHTPPSQWFLLVTAFGSLFMASGKRYAEIRLFEKTGAEIRASLRKYSASYLRFVWATSVAIVITAYSLWAFDDLRVESAHSAWATISIVPFVIALLRYAGDVDSGDGGAPDEIVLRDRILQLLGLCWALTVAFAFYL